MNSINLVSPKNEQLEKEQKRLSMAKILAFVIMFFVIILAVLVFVINLTLPINTIKQAENVTLSNISTLHKKLVQYYLTEDRVNHLSNLVAKRGKLPDTLGALLAIVPSELSINTMSVESDKIALVVSGKSLVSMNKFIDDVILLSEQKHILKNVIIQQLSLDVRGGTYSISIQAGVF
jgi:hypothetical protein